MVYGVLAIGFLLVLAGLVGDLWRSIGLFRKHSRYDHAVVESFLVRGTWVRRRIGFS